MEKRKIGRNAFVYPMPVVLVGAIVDGKPNFLPVGWISRVNLTPPMIGIGLNDTHYTNQGIHEHKQFSINIPSADMVRVVDYCGLVSGAAADKATLFPLHYGELEHAPMIAECALSMECTLVQAVQLPSHTWFIGEIMATYCAEFYMTMGKPDVKKLNPLTLTMPDNNYWLVGANAGQAWRIGKEFVRSR